MKGKSVYLLVLMLSVLFLFSYSKSSSDKLNCINCNVIVILVDSLRADHLGCYGYPRNTSPNIDALAGQSIQYNHAFSAAPWTSASVASLFTSFYPSAHGVTALSERGSETVSSILSADFVTLAEALKENGYATYGVTANAWITPRLGFTQGFDVFQELDYKDGGDAENLTGVALDFIDSADTARPFFMYLHFMDSHMPYEPLPEFDVFNESLDGYSGESQNKINKYDGEILYLDIKLGEFFTHLKEKGIYDKTLIVFLADHGEQFGEHGSMGHGKSVYNVETHVPLLIKSGGVGAERDDTVSLVDVYPTILDIIGVRINHTIQGESLLAGKQGGAFSETTYLVDEQKSFVRSDGKKMIIAYNTTEKLVDRSDELNRQVYDVKTNSREKSGIKEGALSDELAGELYTLYSQTRKYRKNVSVQEAQLTENTIKRLKELGYLN
ncbi:MAG: sulfatase [Candidatus Altiarchaeota archaeon]